MSDFPHLSERMNRIDSSEVRRVFQLAAKLENPINLSIGQPHYPAPPEIQEAIIAALSAGHTAYTQTQGIPELRERMARKYAAQNGFQAHPDNILISSGVSSLIQLLFLATLDPGDEVLISDPCFLIYRSMLNFFNARVTTFPENFSPDDIEPIKKSIQNKKIKLIIFCTPSNPTGHVMSAEQLRMLGEIADGCGAYLVSDEIYELFDYDNGFHSTASIYPRTLTLSGFSKSYSMTGLRLSAATGPEEIIRAMTTLQQYTVVCAPSAVQWAGIRALDLDMKDYVQAYKQNRDYCVQRLKGRTRFTQPAGAFYIFPEVPGTDREFVERAIQTRQLLIVPGRIFTERTNHV
ncbi:MAG: aminotransferase class I/II-fold pyridoxal phosphate-dependent enzyme, partial [Leptospiraceae bacterium]|nr:aminotransferase class I/II-fold pyridoxal phosphate-dependent enzyme [Leptospiraceae bacterium]